jgi:hypothetical protein
MHSSRPTTVDVVDITNRPSSFDAAQDPRYNSTIKCPCHLHRQSPCSLHGNGNGLPLELPSAASAHTINRAHGLPAGATVVQIFAMAHALAGHIVRVLGMRSQLRLALTCPSCLTSLSWSWVTVTAQGHIMIRATISEPQSPTSSHIIP